MSARVSPQSTILKASDQNQKIRNVLTFPDGSLKVDNEHIENVLNKIEKHLSVISAQLSMITDNEINEEEV